MWNTGNRGRVAPCPQGHRRTRLGGRKRRKIASSIPRAEYENSVKTARIHIREGIGLYSEGPSPYLERAKESIMPVTHLVTLIIAVLALSGLTVWAFLSWGAGTVIPLLAALALAVRWAVSPVSPDDTHA
ncbi:hypothetical protein CSE45_1860 [Citreicella sp. SE45]|nr:hypothetical protein CSE45_1860 [Citreicella sp. SE45]